MCGPTAPAAKLKKSPPVWLIVNDPPSWAKVNELRVKPPRFIVLFVCAVPVMTTAVAVPDNGAAPSSQFDPVDQRSVGPSPDQRTTSAATGAAAAARRT